jgi:hypothetical protein
LERGRTTPRTTTDTLSREKEKPPNPGLHFWAGGKRGFAMPSYAANRPGVNGRTPDYLAFDDLLALGLSPDEPLTGHDAQPLVEAERLDDFLELLWRDEVSA